MSASILIVEDEADLASVVADYLGAAGYTTQIIGDGQEALEAFRRAPPSLGVLDLMLPGLDGLALCRAVRGFSDVPLIMVTARVEEIDRLLGLEAGADDYLCKPFSPRELVARVKVILRRLSPNARGASYALDAEARVVRIRGTALELTATEYALFATMAKRPGVIFPRAQLLDVVSRDLDVTDRAIDSHIKNLRRKIERVAPDLELIQSVYGVGYRLERDG